MHGCFDASLVYGWREEEEESEICANWLEQYGLECFAASVVRLHKSGSVYGVDVKVDVASGQPQLPAQEVRDKVAQAYALYQKHRAREAQQKAKKSESESESEQKDDLQKEETGLGFHLAVSGQYESCDGTYTPLEGDAEESDAADADEPPAKRQRSEGSEDQK